ncbi:hypothetical protein CEXT_78251 [Caerostris extrusa]|uniref:Uncharacterized protein n=1 Tax=Caerostris extrusa TaxID=172846 RepID=A0AAV4QGZ3_CAEEX|nr:hypothetical protein CEXT_78251 [Caerostris extrusa]
MTFADFLKIFDQGAGISGTVGCSVPWQADCCVKVYRKKCCPQTLRSFASSKAKEDVLLRGSLDILAERVRLFIIAFLQVKQLWVSFCYSRENKTFNS